MSIPQLCAEYQHAFTTSEDQDVVDAFHQAVTNIIRGKPVLNRDALINPELLDYYESILSDLQRE